MKYYNIKKINLVKDTTMDYGPGLTEEDFKAITKGYKLSDHFCDVDVYSKKNSNSVFYVIVYED
jgi:hypothetical protein